MKNKTDLEIINKIETLYKELKTINPFSKNYDKKFLTFNKYCSELISRHSDTYSFLSLNFNIGTIWKLIDIIKA